MKNEAREQSPITFDRILAHIERRIMIIENTGARVKSTIGRRTILRLNKELIVRFPQHFSIDRFIDPDAIDCNTPEEWVLFKTTHRFERDDYGYYTNPEASLTAIVDSLVDNLGAEITGMTIRPDALWVQPVFETIKVDPETFEPYVAFHGLLAD